MNVALYRTLLDRQKAICKAFKNTTPPEEIMRQVILSVLKIKGIKDSSIEAWIIDSLYESRQRPSLIIENNYFIQHLLSSQLDTDPKLLRYPLGGCFSINPPRNARAGGKPIPSFLFSVAPKREIAEWADKLFAAYQIPLGTSIWDEGLVYAVTYKDTSGADITAEWTTDDVCKMLQTDPSEWTVLFNLENQNCSRDEHLTMQVCFRLGFTITLYCNAFPGSLVQGLPQTVLAFKQHMQNVHHLIGTDVFRTSPSAHLRSGHFRTLGHERFKRNPDGSVRVVFVHPCIVNAEIDPYTLEEQP